MPHTAPNRAESAPRNSLGFAKKPEDTRVVVAMSGGRFAPRSSGARTAQ